MKTEYLECACFSDEHILIFRYDEQEGDLWAEIHLSNEPFYKRIIQAVKHIFGYKCKYGCFNTWTLNEEHIDKIINMLQLKKNFEQKIQE